MAKKTTKANTGLSLTRNGAKFTLGTWKIKAKDVDWQKVRYRTFDGVSWSDWIQKKVGKKKTSFSFELDPTASITRVQAQTKTDRDGKDYKPSAWDSASAVFEVTPPPNPVLLVSNDSANKTTFSWTINASDTDSAWFYRCYYRTKCTETPDSDADWSDWTYAADASYEYTDNTLNRTRIFQIKAVGPGGESEIQTERHVIGLSPVATWSESTEQTGGGLEYAVTYTDRSSYYEMTYNVNLSASRYTADSIVPQYYIGMPDANMNCPSGANWVDGSTYNYAEGRTNYPLAITTGDVVDEDECLWARVKTEHDGAESYSDAYRVITGKLKAPTATVSMGTPTASGFSVTINVTDDGTDVPGAYKQVYLERYSVAGIENYILIGTIANGAASATINSSLDITGESGYAIHIRNVTSDGVSMRSGFYSYATSMPTAPTLSEVRPTNAAGKVWLSWVNNWSDATGVIITWAQDPDDWMSNQEPESYEITELASGWYITGLETGVTWYFRVRSVMYEDESETLSPWSDILSIDLSSAPAVPVLYLSDEAIPEDGMVTAYWSYVTTDGTSQVAGNIVRAYNSGGAWTYSDPIISVTSAQHVDIYAEEQGWTDGTTVYLALQTRSGSGGTSEYSTPVQLAIAAKPTVTVTTNSLKSTDTVTEYFYGDTSTTAFLCAYDLTAAPTVTVDGETVTATYSGDTVTLPAAPAEGSEIKIVYTTADYKALDTMPLTATVTTTNAATITTAIERDGAYPMERPDGKITDGADGETIYVRTLPAAATNSISIHVGDLIGRLDDGAFYKLIFTAEDAYGQSVQAEPIRFKVHWAHQAWEPTAHFKTDFERYAARILPIAGAEYVSGDTCDIYRIGIDGPELIYSGAEFGTEYVDPYPAFGPASGYKVVTVTATKDYITEDDMFAEYDSSEEGGYPQLDPGTLVIDFEGDRAELPYNITMDNTWEKDFQRTVYLGGHVVGDHNKAVTRDMNASSVLVRGDTDGVAELMRALAQFAGICHVRTPEGSSFAADVQVSEAMSFDTKKIDYRLTIKAVDTVGFDGMTYSDWRETL